LTRTPSRRKSRRSTNKPAVTNSTLGPSGQASSGLCHDGPCVRVVFPLPNGNAIVVMRPTAGEGGSFVVVSSGKRFGDPGFYFTVRAETGEVWARYVPQLRETIRVYEAQDGARADHLLTIWGAAFLRLHYRMRLAA
jgi:hypothetical protein